jgi:hypothetical protein
LGQRVEEVLVEGRIVILKLATCLLSKQTSKQVNKPKVVFMTGVGVRVDSLDSSPFIYLFKAIQKIPTRILLDIVKLILEFIQ